jgi:hypothetical protein
MKTLAFRFAAWGAVLGLLAGLFESTIGAAIRPWIGNKESPFILGLVTVSLRNSPLWASFNWGWYLSVLGSSLIFLSAFWQELKPGTLFILHSLSGEKPL